MKKWRDLLNRNIFMKGLFIYLTFCILLIISMFLMSNIDETLSSSILFILGIIMFLGAIFLIASHTVDFQKLRNEHKEANKLYYCDGCKKYFREYLMNFFNAKNYKRINAINCPHCGGENGYGVSIETTELDETPEYSWLKTHIHCRYIYLNEYHKISSDINSLIKKKREINTVNTLETYNKQHTDSILDSKVFKEN